MYSGDEYYGDDVTSPLVRPQAARASRIRIRRGTEIVHQASGRTAGMPSTLIVSAELDQQSGCMVFTLPSYGRCYVAEGWEAI